VIIGRVGYGHVVLVSSCDYLGRGSITDWSMLSDKYKLQVQEQQSLIIYCAQLEKIPFGNIEVKRKTLSRFVLWSGLRRNVHHIILKSVLVFHTCLLHFVSTVLFEFKCVPYVDF